MNQAKSEKLSTSKEEKLSKFMSLILRHKPKKFGVTLDKDGFCTVENLVDAINQQDNWSGVSTDNVYQVVKNCPKQRYALDGNKIRANYGHSSVKIKRNAATPPDILYHGTNTNVVDKILVEGIKKMERDVHLSEGLDFATLAGKRRGELVILQVDAKKAYEDGVEFFYAENEVWLTEFVPPKYLTKLKK